jgi:hypothetical protein
MASGIKTASFSAVPSVSQESALSAQNCQASSHMGDGPIAWQSSRRDRYRQLRSGPAGYIPSIFWSIMAEAQERLMTENGGGGGTGRFIPGGKFQRPALRPLSD